MFLSVFVAFFMSLYVNSLLSFEISCSFVSGFYCWMMKNVLACHLMVVTFDVVCEHLVLQLFNKYRSLLVTIYQFFVTVQVHCGFF